MYKSMCQLFIMKSMFTKAVCQKKALKRFYLNFFLGFYITLVIFIFFNEILADQQLPYYQNYRVEMTHARTHAFICEPVRGLV